MALQTLQDIVFQNLRSNTQGRQVCLVDVAGDSVAVFPVDHRIEQIRRRSALVGFAAGLAAGAALALLCVFLWTVFRQPPAPSPGAEAAQQPAAADAAEAARTTPADSPVQSPQQNPPVKTDAVTATPAPAAAAPVNAALASPAASTQAALTPGAAATQNPAAATKPAAANPAAANPAAVNPAAANPVPASPAPANPAAANAASLNPPTPVPAVASPLASNLPRAPAALKLQDLKNEAEVVKASAARLTALGADEKLVFAGSFGSYAAALSVFSKLHPRNETLLVRGRINGARAYLVLVRHAGPDPEFEKFRREISTRLGVELLKWNRAQRYQSLMERG